MTELVEQVFAAYQKKCENEGAVYTQPSKNLTKVGWKYIYLYNNYGELAKYNKQTGEFV